MYIKNKDLYLLFLRRKETPDDTRNNNAIASAMMQIAERLITKRNFSNDPKLTEGIKQEMVLDAIENCWRSVDSFNPYVSNNPFSYFTQITINAFIRRINKEEKEKQKVINSNIENELLEEDEE